MVIHAPFIRWFYKEHASYLNTDGGYYYVITDGGDSGDETIVVEIEHYETNHVIYKAHDDFKRDYAHILGLSDNLRWNLESLVIEWLNPLIRNSFVRYSTVGNFVLF